MDWPAQLSSLHIIAIGRGTARALTERGMTVNELPLMFNTEGILALSSLQSIQNKKIAIFCGKDGRMDLQQQLIQRGAIVTRLVCYRREPITIDHNIQVNKLRQYRQAVVVCTSEQGLRAWFNLWSTDDNEWLAQITLLVISNKMADVAKALGHVARIIIAPNATDEAITETLCRDMIIPANTNKTSEKTMNKKRHLPLLLATSLSIFIAVSLVSLAGVAYLFYRQPWTAAINQTVVSADQRQQLLVAKIDSLQAQFNQQQQKTQPQPQRFNQISYYLYSANLQLTVNHNIRLAAALLQKAHDDLLTQQDPKLLPLQQSIAHDLANLNAATQVDITSLMATFNTLQAAIKQLPLIAPVPINESSVKMNEQPTAHWQQRLQHLLLGLKSIIVIRRVDQPLKPILTLAQKQLLQIIVVSQLMQAQWAVLHRNMPLYLASLKQVKQWLNNYYPLSTAKDQTIDQINQLLAINIDPEIPTIQQSLSQLEKLTSTAD